MRNSLNYAPLARLCTVELSDSAVLSTAHCMCNAVVWCTAK